MRNIWDDDGDLNWLEFLMDLILPVIAWAVVIAVIFAVGSLFTSCATYDAVVGAPPEFWMTGEAIIIAILQDIYDLIDLLL